MIRKVQQTTENFVLGSWLTTEKAENIDEMFRECKFSNGFRLSSKFEMGPVKSKLNVFTDSKGKDGATLQIFGEKSLPNF